MTLDRSSFRAQTYEYEKLVLGSSLNAVVYSYINQLPLVFNTRNVPKHFEYFSKKLDLEYPGLETVTSKLDLWRGLCFSLSLSGLILLAGKKYSLRLEENNQLVSFFSSSKVIFKFSELHVFDGSDVEGIIEKSPKEQKYQVFDWFDVRTGMSHPHSRIETASSFVNCIHFYPSERVDGDHNKKDLVAISYLTFEQLNDIVYSDTYARFKIKKIMKDNNIRGKRNGRNPNYPENSPEPYKYVSVVLEHNRREIRKIHDASYEKIENVYFLNKSVEDLCLKP